MPISLSLGELKKMLIDAGDRTRLNELNLTKVGRDYAELTLMSKKLSHNKSMDEEYLHLVHSQLSILKQELSPHRLSVLDDIIKQIFPYYFTT